MAVTKVSFNRNLHVSRSCHSGEIWSWWHGSYDEGVNPGIPWKRRRICRKWTLKRVVHDIFWYTKEGISDEIVFLYRGSNKNGGRSDFGRESWRHLMNRNWTTTKYLQLICVDLKTIWGDATVNTSKNSITLPGDFKGTSWLQVCIKWYESKTKLCEPWLKHRKQTCRRQDPMIFVPLTSKSLLSIHSEHRACGKNRAKGQSLARTTEGCHRRIKNGARDT